MSDPALKAVSVAAARLHVHMFASSPNGENSLLLGEIIMAHGVLGVLVPAFTPCRFLESSGFVPEVLPVCGRSSSSYDDAVFKLSPKLGDCGFLTKPPFVLAADASFPIWGYDGAISGTVPRTDVKKRVD